MQEDMNIAMGNATGRYGERKYRAYYKNEYGKVGAYYCEAATLDQAILETQNVATEYPGTELGAGERITLSFVDELHASGNRTAAYEA